MYMQTITAPSESEAHTVIYVLHIRGLTFRSLARKRQVKLREKQVWARKKCKTGDPREISVFLKNALKSITIDTRVFSEENE